MSESKLGTAYVAIRAKLDDLDKDLEQARTKVEKSLSSALSGVGGKIAGVGGKLSVGVTAPLVGLGAAALDVGGQFDEVMDTIRTTTGATGDALTGLGQDALAVFKAIPTNMATAGQAIAELAARTGQSGAGLQSLAQAEIELARITGGELGPQIANTTRMFGDWGVAVTDQVPALDALLRAHQTTGIGVDQLAGKLVQFGAPLRQMGFDFDTSAALIGKFEKEGVNTELVLGSMRVALGKMAKAGVEPVEGLRALISEIQGTGSTAEANSLAIAAFGARAGPDMAAAIREGRFSVDELVNTIAGGSETIMGAAEQTNDYAERFTVLKNQVTAAAIPLGTTLFDSINKLMPTIEKVINFVAGLIEKFANLPNGTQTAILAIAGIAAAIGPVITTIGGLVSAAGSVGAAFGAGGALAGVGAALAPILPVIAAIGAAVALLVAAWNGNWFGIRDTLTAVWTGTIQPALQSLIEWLQTAIPQAIQALSDFWNNTLLPALRTVWEFIETNLIPLFRALAELLTAVVGVAITALQGLWQNVLLPAIKAVWKFIQENVLPIFQTLAEKLEGPLATALGVAQRLFDSLKGALEGIGGAVQRVIGWIGTLTDKIRNIKLPDWLTPGSPTPFELGLRGIADAVAMLARVELPVLQAQLALAEPATIGVGALPDVRRPVDERQAGNQITINMTLPVGTNAEMREAARAGANAGVLAALRAMGAA